MKKLVGLVFCFVVVLQIVFLSSALAEYAIKQLSSTESYDNFSPVINEAGQVVWGARDYTEPFIDYEIFFYDGSGTIQLTDNYLLDDRLPDLNNYGQVVWSGRMTEFGDYEIFLYDGTEIVQITENSTNDVEPKINDAGHIAWRGFDGTDDEIYLYREGEVIQLSNNTYPDYNPQISRYADKVVWQSTLGSVIYLYDGVSVKSLSGSIFGSNPFVNYTGQAVWYSTGGSSSEQEIYFYNGSETVQITSNTLPDNLPRINNAGQISWIQNTGPNSEIMLWDGNTTNISNSDRLDSAPFISNLGQVAWHGWNELGCQIFLFDGVEKVAITNDENNNLNPQVNSASEITWESGYVRKNIFLATPVEPIIPWCPASTIGSQLPSNIFNYLLITLLPLAFLLRVWRKQK